MSDTQTIKAEAIPNSEVKSTVAKPSDNKPVASKTAGKGSAAVTWMVNIVGTIAVAGGIAAFTFYPRAAEKPGEGMAAATETTEDKKDPNIVKITESQKATIVTDEVAAHAFQPERECTGRIVYNDDKTTPVYAEFTGRIGKIFKEPGQSVAKDEILYEIDTPDLVQAETDLINAENALRKSRSALKLAQASKAIATSNLGIAKRSLDIAERNIGIAKISEHLAEINQERQKGLVADKAVAQKDYEQAQRDMQSAIRDSQTALRDKESALRDAAQSQKDSEQADSDIETSTADIESGGHIRTALRDRLKVVFGKTDEEIDRLLKERVIDRITKVKAPIAGTIASKKLSHGQYVTPSTPDPLFTITDLSSMWLVADVYEADSPRIHKGLKVNVKALAFPDAKLEATVSYVAPNVNPDTRRVGVRCVIHRADDAGKPDDKVLPEFKSEMFATFTIPIGDPVTSSAVPYKAVVRDGLVDVVYVAKSEMEFERRVVTIGMTQDMIVEKNGAKETVKIVQIIEGLKKGERIVVGGAIFVNSEGR